MARYNFGDKSFVNPYNFIPLTKNNNKKKCDSETKDNSEKYLYGVLHCHFETKTPLAIPDVEFATIDNDKYTSYPFYRINNVPSVPGSSIRGMLRSVYETLTDSCFVTLPEDASVTARVIPRVKNVFNPGILKYEGKKNSGYWKLYNAKRHYLPIGKDSKFLIKIDDNGRYIKYGNNEYRTGEPVKIGVHQKKEEVRGRIIKKSIVDKISKTDSSDTYLYVGEDIKGKKYESVFEIKDEVKISKEEIERLLNGLKNSIKIYQNPSINKMFKQKIHTGYKNFEQAVKNGAACIWYKEDNGKYYFSMAAIGRKAYNKTVNDMIGEHRNPCIVIEPDKKDDNKKEENKYKNLCPACRLFGMANGGGYGSKIRITDATVKDGDESKMLGFKTLKELGSPRIGYYPFYTCDGEEYDKPGVTIAGRKFYWHIPRAKDDASVYETSEKTERNATMELMGANAKFKFDVYYDNVSKEQLNEIKWVLALPDETQRLMHKLGHGKPLGLGSIKITIDSDERRVFKDGNYKVTNEPVDEFDNMPSRFEGDIWKQLAVICNFETMEDKEVCYPFVSLSENVEETVREQEDRGYELKPNVTAGHQWFNEFKKQENEFSSISEASSKTLSNLMVNNVVDCGRNSDFQEHLGEREEGIIKVYKENQFGFIKTKNGNEIYFNEKEVDPNIVSLLKKNTKVSFCEGIGRKGKVAKKIKLVE